MKRRWAAAAAVLLALCAGGAHAQELPDTACFSPGLAAAWNAAQAGEGLHVTATVSVDSALYARDLSVLSAMLEGTQFTYDGTEDADALAITRGGETLFSGALERSGEEDVITLNGEGYRVEDASQALGALLGVQLPEETLSEAMLRAPRISLLKRLPLAEAADWLETLTAGTELFAGVAVTQDFAVERTLSDDGTRVTKLSLSGAAAYAGGESWTVSGTMQQTVGSAPKTTAELTVARDKSNTFTITLSSTRKSTVTRRDKAGENAVDTVLKVSGKLEGYSVTTQLTLRLRNDWTADGEKLTEKIVISGELGHTDKTPGRRMQRLNDLNLKLRQAISMTTREADEALPTLTDSVTLDFKMDGNTLAAGSAQLSVRLGGESLVAREKAQVREAEPQALSEAAQEAVLGIARRLWAQLDEADRKKITSGL